MVEITVEGTMVVEETSKLAAEVQDDTYEFSLIFCLLGFFVDSIFDTAN